MSGAEGLSYPVSDHIKFHKRFDYRLFRRRRSNEEVAPVIGLTFYLLFVICYLLFALFH